MRIISGSARGTKLYTLDGYETTRPTLDRVKEALFSKIAMNLPESIVLDLFAGSGALGLEAVSRGAEKAYLVDSSGKAIKIIKQNVTKTHFEEKTVVLQEDYQVALENFQNRNLAFDVVFLDPPYKTDFALQATKLILENKLLKDTGILVIETDIEETVLPELEKLCADVIDVKKYGRVTLIFIRRKG
ncbi:MAG: 16S rRNA (guanine(966)-N(2))-methyltransferase RsmD [Clostridia bacterium]|nr:16S rRNA (guanine(966)-N(2))-methyltransferase RsmD [Clostridia bacterium]